jgi:uncharacterized membrane protein
MPDDASHSTAALAALPESADLALAGALLVLGVRRRGFLGAALSIAGAALAVRVLRTPLEDALRREGGRRRAAQVRTSLLVERPVREMFAFWSDFANFPRLIEGLEGVQDFGDGRSRWTLRLGSGALLEWDATVTKYVPGQVIAWESVADSPVASAGIVRFEALGPTRTRLDVDVSWAPGATSTREALRAFTVRRGGDRLRDELARAGEKLRGWAPGDPLAELRAWAAAENPDDDSRDSTE